MAEHIISTMKEVSSAYLKINHLAKHASGIPVSLIRKYCPIHHRLFYAKR